MRLWAFGPGDPHSLYTAARFDPVLRSRDDGATFEAVVAPTGPTLALASDPNDAERCVVVSFNGSAVVHDAAGATPISSTRRFLGVSWSPLDTEHLWLWHQAGLDVTTDTGATVVETQLGTSPRALAFDEGAVYVATADGVHSTRDGGVTFSRIALDGVDVTALDIDRCSGRLFAATAQGIEIIGAPDIAE